MAYDFRFMVAAPKLRTICVLVKNVSLFSHLVGSSHFLFSLPLPSFLFLGSNELKFNSLFSE